MNLLKFKNIRVTIVVTCISSLLTVVLLSSLSLIVVGDSKILIIHMFMIAGLYILQGLVCALAENMKYESNFFSKLQLNKWVDQYVIEQEYETFYAKKPGELASLYVNDIPTVVSLLNQRYLTMISNSVQALFVFCSLYLIHPYIFAMGVIVAFVMGIAPKCYNHVLQNAILLSQDAKEQFLYHISELLKYFPVFYVKQSFGYYLHQSSHICEDYSHAISYTDKVGANLTVILDVISSLLSLITLTLTSFLVIQGQLHAGALLSSISLIPLLSSSISNVMTEKSFYKSGQELFAQKFNGIVGEYDETLCCSITMKSYMKKQRHINNCVKETHKDIETIETKGLQVSFDQKKIQFPDIKIEKGKKYILKGKSGSGKSTFLKILLGLIKDYDGDIYVNGVLQKKEESLIGSIGYMSQDVVLLNDTFTHNICLGESENETNIKCIMDEVGLSQFSSSDMIEKSGSNLSGGQQQRVIIARALIDNKDIYFVDEATAHLDKQSSIDIEKKLLQSDKTIVMITHHLYDEVKEYVDSYIDIDCIKK